MQKLVLLMNCLLFARLSFPIIDQWWQAKKKLENKLGLPFCLEAHSICKAYFVRGNWQERIVVEFIEGVFNPWSLGGVFTVHKMAVSSPIPSFKG